MKLKLFERTTRLAATTGLAMLLAVGSAVTPVGATRWIAA